MSAGLSAELSAEFSAFKSLFTVELRPCKVGTDVGVGKRTRGALTDSTLSLGVLVLVLVLEEGLGEGNPLGEGELDDGTIMGIGSNSRFGEGALDRFGDLVESGNTVSGVDRTPNDGVGMVASRADGNKY